MQFGAEPLFENISAKFGNGNRYGLIGANGCGKSTFMKILSGALTPSSGNVSMTPGQKLGVLSQDQFAFEKYSVIDVVIMGDKKLWEIKQERERIYSLPEMSEEDGMAVAELESQFAEMDGYTAESRAGQILLDAGIAEELHFGLMEQVAVLVGPQNRSRARVGRLGIGSKGRRLATQYLYILRRLEPQSKDKTRGA